jgi:hypothetical protein
MEILKCLEITGFFNACILLKPLTCDIPHPTRIQMQKHLATANFNLFLISIAVIENIARGKLLTGRADSGWRGRLVEKIYISSTILPRQARAPKCFHNFSLAEGGPAKSFYNSSTILLRQPHSMLQQFTLVRRQRFHGNFVKE